MHQIAEGSTDDQIELIAAVFPPPQGDAGKSRASHRTPVFAPISPAAAACWAPAPPSAASAPRPAAPARAPGGPSIGRAASSSWAAASAAPTAARSTTWVWGGDVDVTLVERDAFVVSCPISNLVLGGHRQIADVSAQLRRPEGRRRRGGPGRGAAAIDAAARKVRLASAPSCPWDRLIVSPGVGLHARAGRDGCTAALDSGRIRMEGRPADRGAAPAIESMPDGGIFAMSIPKVPYRCPPGPTARHRWPAT
jgi:sulfite dehydrogenase